MVLNVHHMFLSDIYVLYHHNSLSSATTRAFANSLSSYLTFYNATIALLHTEADSMGLLEVYNRVGTLSVVVEGLCGLCGCDVSSRNGALRMFPSLTSRLRIE